ncbi:uncharacterized protein EI90DRAFT_3019251 [Cantharellus anzutake]|uniref:uncharacterized protein n=1 Tax=Cantharellus anzutake TaxID=1750568 RepID=UPI00190355F4|nr:uncharacterized protein EI90DRAFT_3019251 [Cantharellus anzutake]KAF8325067.1 hypothetical protein EI90DRAFT_3019251 [Cantharellus anzutake]
MHDGFLRDQAERTQRQLDEEELEQVKEEAKEQWKRFNNSQKAEIAKWQEEKAHLAALKQKVLPKPSEVQMREWMAKNYISTASTKPRVSLGASGSAEQSQHGSSVGFKIWTIEG